MILLSPELFCVGPFHRISMAQGCLPFRSHHGVYYRFELMARGCLHVAMLYLGSWHEVALQLHLLYHTIDDL